MNYSCIKIALANQKGGVGKTTTAVNLATSLATVNYRVLLIDLDPQGNASTSFNIDNRDNNIYRVMTKEINIEDAISPTLVPNLDIITSVVDLSAVEFELSNVSEREYILKNIIETIEVKNNYDIILIDCPPSLGLLTINALTLSNSMIIPLQCEFLALEGLSHLLHTYELVKDNLNPNLEIEGIVLTMYDKRNKLTEHVEKDVRDYLGEWVFSTVVPRNVKLSEAPSHGKPAIIYDVNCNGSRAYLNLTKEVISRIKRYKTYGKQARKHQNVG